MNRQNEFFLLRSLFDEKMVRIQCHAGLLEQLQAPTGRGGERPPRNLPLEAWVLMLQMTEDEDDALRKESARCLGKCLQRLSGSDLEHATLDFVQRACFTALAGNCCGDLAFLQQLLDWIRYSRLALSGSTVSRIFLQAEHV